MGMSFVMQLQSLASTTFAHLSLSFSSLQVEDLTVSFYSVAGYGGAFMRMKMGIINADGLVSVDTYPIEHTIRSFMSIPASLHICTRGIETVMQAFVNYAFPDCQPCGDLHSVYAGMNAQLQAWMSRQSLSESSVVRPYHWTILWLFTRQDAAARCGGCLVSDLRLHEPGADVDEHIGRDAFHQ
jgi:hypothetical protein